MAEVPGCWLGRLPAGGSLEYASCNPVGTRRNGLSDYPPINDRNPGWISQLDARRNPIFITRRGWTAVNTIDSWKNLDNNACVPASAGRVTEFILIRRVHGFL